MMDPAKTECLSPSDYLSRRDPDLKPGLILSPAAAEYLQVPARKLALFRKYGLVKTVRFGKWYAFRIEWLDEFIETWAGYDLGSEEKIRLAINARKWKATH